MKLDLRTIIAVIVTIIIGFLLPQIWKYLNQNIEWIQPVYQYKKLINVLIIILLVLFIEKKSISSVGLKLGDWKKTLKATLLCSLSVLLVVFLIAVFWKQLNQLRIEGEHIYFIGQQIPMGMISFKLLYILFLNQVLTVALPEEIIYRGYFQSRLNFTWSPLISILGSTIVFALIHFDRPLMFLHLVLIGPIYGYTYHYSKSIIPTTIAHYLSNIGGIIIIKFVALNF
ncbi:MAG TPA: CPBP family intramembrane glutamic endopeptidase [Bacteroidales bacterium]|nr:CPBP family intramembrane glutamic endopeptidase [Bacteroidales bacterium]